MICLSKNKNGKLRYSINGTILRGELLPKVGLSTVQNVGTDSYARKIAEVSPDFTWFKHDDGSVAVLVTRKNSQRCGHYVAGTLTNGKPKPGPTPYITCMGYDTYHIVSYEAETYYDPHF